MSDESTISFSNLKTRGSDFTFTGKLADYARNDKWVEAYNNVLDSGYASSGLETLWKTVSTGSEDSGNEIFKEILNYIDKVGNIDTCDLNHLRDFAEYLGSDSDLIDNNIEFPKEIYDIISILSINRAYLYNKENSYNEQTNEGYDTLSLEDSVLDSSTILSILTSLGSTEEFKNMIHNCIYNTIMNFLNLKNVNFDDSKHGITTMEIWKTDTKRFTDNLWSDDIESDSEIFKLKKSLSVNKQFTEKLYADDIIAGNKKLSDFSDAEQIVIKKEIESRKNRYSDTNSMKYYYMRLYKVLEYFRFCSTLYNTVYKLSSYDLDDNKYIIKSYNDDSNVLIFNYNSYEINTTMVHKITDWITDYIIEISKLRTTLRSQCQKNTMRGTKRLIIDVIRKFILDNIGSDAWLTAQNSIFKLAKFNTNFDIDIIQYIDTTDYTNIENTNDTVLPSEHTLNPRYWENYNDLNNAISNEEVLNFFNRISDDEVKFKYNKDDGKSSDVNLYEFLSVLFETGAIVNDTFDYNLSSNVYTVSDGNKIKYLNTSKLSDEEKTILKKYSGDDNIGEKPYSNIKNSFHPSRQLMPFIQAFEEYTEVYTMISNLVSSYTSGMTESLKNLKKRIDKYGNTVNFWYNWNDDFTGYSTTSEKKRISNVLTDFCDSPYNFDALKEYLDDKDSFISSLINDNNKYYIDPYTEKSLLDEDGKIKEISRLQNYYNKIKSNANREIYTYGKDYNGNIYILYKNSGNRKNRNALGDIWIRPKNHPIAFPLFDINSTKSGFNSISVLSETNNNKLLELLYKIIVFFKDTYGKNHFKNDSYENDGNFIPINIGITYGTYSKTLPVLFDSKSKSSSAEPVFDYTYKDFKIEKTSKLKLIKPINSEMDNYIKEKLEVKTIYNIDNDYISYDAPSSVIYFVDSVTNAIVRNNDTEEKGTYSKVYYIDNDYNLCEYGGTYDVPMLDSPSADMFFALYNNSDKTFKVGLCDNANINNITGNLVFAEYTDENIVEDGMTYYCRDTSCDYNKTHPCTKHKMTVNRLFKLDIDALSGTVDLSGNVHFGGDIDYSNYEHETPYSNFNKTLNLEEEISAVDGGMIYQDFSKYKFKYDKDKEEYVTDISNIVFVGGSNAFYVDDDGENITFLKAEYIESGPEENYYKFCDNIYRENITSEFLSSLPLSDCVFYSTNNDTSNQNDSIVDKIGQFSIRNNPYKLYYPYTVIDGHPVEVAEGSKLKDVYDGYFTIVGKDEKTHTFCYNLSSLNGDDEDDDTIDRKVRIKGLRYYKYTETVNITSVKLNGDIRLTSSDAADYTINLSFDDTTENNIAYNSDIMSVQNQRKFFDFGFSYNQKVFYMTYFNDDYSYINSGTIVGRFSDVNDNGSNKLIFYRDSNKNIEYFDSDSVGYESDGELSECFHVGDCSTRNGVISVYCKKYNSTNSNDETIELIINLVTDINVYKYKYNIPLRYGLYTFEDGLYNFNTSCTFDRLFVSFVSNPPEDDDIISNSIDKQSIGKSGSTKLKNYHNNDIDSTITILAFDISDNTNIVMKDDETRYLMNCGKYGFFNQFGGFDGKNNIFLNEKLSSDTEFSFSIGFDQLTENVGSINFYTEYTSKIQGEYGDYVSEPNGRFINIYPTGSDAEEISGVVISDNNKYAFMSIASTSGGNSVQFTNFDNKLIYDMSRGIGNNLMYFADGDDTDTRVGAFYNETSATGYKSINGMKMIKVPIHTELSGYYHTDFVQLADYGETVYAFCSDRNTIVKTNVKKRSANFIPTSGLIKITYDNGETTVKQLADGDIIKKYDEVRTDYYIKKDGYSNSSKAGSQKCSYIINGNYITIFGVYDDKIITIYSQYSSSKYYSIPFFVNSKNGTVPYIFEYDDLAYDEVNKTELVRYKILKIEENGSKTEIINKESYEGDISYHYVLLDSSDAIKGIADTYDGDDFENSPNKVLYSTRGGIYKYSLGNDSIMITKTLDIVKDEISIEDNYSIDVNVHTCTEHIVTSYYDNITKSCGLLQVRRTVPYAIGNKVSVYDINGNTLTGVKVKNILSANGVVLIDDELTGLVYISEDDGESFNVLQESIEYEIKLIGCSNSNFYIEYSNGEKSYSSDGRIWKNAINIPFSEWIVFNANGNDYIACETYDEDLENDIVDKNYYVEIENMVELENGSYDGISINSDGTIICYGGMDGKSSIKIARSSSIDDEFEYFTFKYALGFAYNNVEYNLNDLIFAPDGSSNALVIRNAFNLSEDPYTEYIDITNATNNTINSFGGLEHNCGNLMMFPCVGNRILIYNANTGVFHNFMSFGSTMYFSDMDSIDGTDDADSIITSRYIESDGTVRFYRTNFENKDNYGLVEIDEGFPIMITYGEYNTKFSYEGQNVHIYAITFTFLNDYNRKTVTILSQPDLSELDGTEKLYAEKIIASESSKSSLYVSGNSSVCYKFSTIDDSNRYKIEKVYKKNSVTKENVDFLSVTYDLESIVDRSNVYFDYEMKENTDGAISLYREFGNSEYTIELKNSDISNKTSFKIYITEDMLDEEGKYDFKLTAQFNAAPNNACKIYWGDGEVYENIIDAGSGNINQNIVFENAIVKDGKLHIYNHSYYSVGEHVIWFEWGLDKFRCGIDLDNYNDIGKIDTTRTDVKDRPQITYIKYNNLLSQGDDISTRTYKINGKETEYIDTSKLSVSQCIKLSNSEYLVSTRRSFAGCINMTGPLPYWGMYLTDVSQTYYGCKSIVSKTVPDWRQNMTDISDCYNGCIGIG